MSPKNYQIRYYFTKKNCRLVRLPVRFLDITVAWIRLSGIISLGFTRSQLTTESLKLSRGLQKIHFSNVIDSFVFLMCIAALEIRLFWPYYRRTKLAVLKNYCILLTESALKEIFWFIVSLLQYSGYIFFQARDLVDCIYTVSKWIWTVDIN